MKIRISITSRVTADGETQTTTQAVSGFLRQSENSLELTYREPTGDEGLGNTLTSLRIFPARLELSRQGDYRCLLVMEAGNRHDCEYNTPFGNLTLTTDTTLLCSSLSPNGTGELSVCYTLSSGNEPTQHELHVTVQPL